MNRKKSKLTIFFVLVIFLGACSPSSTPPPPLTYWPTNGWRSSTPEEQGMDSQVLAQMVDHIQQEKLDLHSLLIVRNGYLVSEIYVYPYSANQAHDVFSVTKSVISALLGIAIQQGDIKDVQLSASSLLSDQWPANIDSKKQSITIENLLTQTSGLDCNDSSPTTGVMAMMSTLNWLNFVLSQPLVSSPGEKFNYCTTAIQVLSAVIQKATGVSAREFANQYLFAPLGINPIPVERWPSDPQGISWGGYGLSLTPQEMAKLGLLYLNKGQWDGQAIVPTDWVNASTTRHSNLGAKKEYGYLWWIDPQGTWYAALGRGGQHIFVYPGKNLVVTFTASLPGENDLDLIPLQEVLNQYILPSIKSNRPLTAKPDGTARLAAGIQSLSKPVRTSPDTLPAIRMKFLGRSILSVITHWAGKP